MKYNYKFKTCNCNFFSCVAPSLLKFVGKNYGFAILYGDASRFLKSNQFSPVFIKTKVQIALPPLYSKDALTFSCELIVTDRNLSTLKQNINFVCKLL